MKEFKNQIISKVLLERGIDPHEYLNKNTDLDPVIIDFAGRVVNESAERLVFAPAYRCEKTWEGVKSYLEKNLGKKYSISTLEKYGNAAKAKVMGKSKDSKELDEWADQLKK
jgi:hypothetical protein